MRPLTMTRFIVFNQLCAASLVRLLILAGSSVKRTSDQYKQTRRFFSFRVPEDGRSIACTIQQETTRKNGKMYTVHVVRATPSPHIHCTLSILSTHSLYTLSTTHSIFTRSTLSLIYILTIHTLATPHSTSL